MRSGPGRESDSELVERCRKGDQAAWEALVSKYRHFVYSIPHRSGLGAEEAGDVFQAVFLALIRHLDTLRKQESLIPWLVTTAKRESWKLRARQSRERPVAGDADAVPSPADAPADFLEQAERQIAVRSALDRIDVRCRELLGLLFYRDPVPDYKEISTLMKMPVPSIGPTRIRCLEKLRRELKRAAFF